MAFPPLPQRIRTRIAPTPSGLLHPGNGAAFVLTWKLARQAGGTILLRIDDLDAERVRAAYVEDIFRTLEWLGIDWDEGPTGPADLEARWSQQHRTERYLEAVERLRATGHLYACRCSRTELTHCACRTAGLGLEADGVTWRLDLQAAPAVPMRRWPGTPVPLEPSRLMPQDPVIRQRNGRPAYQVASLVEDLDHRIDLVVRGEDLLPSTACQLYMAHLLNEPRFGQATFVHHGLLTDVQGAKLSKSQGAGSLQAMRAQGVDPQRIHALADRLLEAVLGRDQA
jgi:glutamyl-tRNA synthetase